MGRIRNFDRDAVLESAVDVFWERGYDGAGMQEICRVTGLNPGSVYAAFGDKHGLFIEALKSYMASMSRETIARLNSNPSGRAGIADYYAALIEAMLDGKRRWGCLVTNSIVEFAMNDPQISEAFQLHLARLETAYLARSSGQSKRENYRGTSMRPKLPHSSYARRKDSMSWPRPGPAGARWRRSRGMRSRRLDSRPESATGPSRSGRAVTSCLGLAQQDRGLSMHL